MVQREESDASTGGKRHRARASDVESLPVLRPDAAGIDIGSRSHWVAVPPDRDADPVREFGSFTADLQKLADWLTSCGIKTVAMESTGVYWIPLFELLESRGFEVQLVCASHIHNVPGRKSDVLDCRWIQRLHACGLLRGSFRPPEQVVELRAYLRQHERLVHDAARAIQHMQKALLEMNLQLHHAINDITGVTGLKIVRAIVGGERDGHKLAAFRDPRCKQPREVIVAALQGTYKPEHLFELEQALATYDFYQEQIKACQKRIETRLDTLRAHVELPEVPCPPPPPGRAKSARLGLDVRSPLHRICGNVDLTQIPGIAPATALTVIAEVGTDMSPWPSEKHFTSWLNLAPGTKITGGKRLSGRRGPSNNRAGLALRQAAVSVGRTLTALGGFYRRIAAHRGAAIAVVATARKLGVLVFNALKHGQAFVEQGLAAYDQLQAERQLRSMKKRAAAMGYQVLPLPVAEGVT
jgi:transposase